MICSSLRLARFTADIYITNKPIDNNEYFTGVPSPAAAGLILVPFFIFFEFGFDFLKNPYLNFFNTILIAFLMISKIPTISLKKINIEKKYRTWVFLILILLIILLISKLWISLSLLCSLYVLSILYTIYDNRISKL